MASSAPQRASITFLVVDAFGGGGVARSVVNLANALVRTRPVTVISLYRRRRRPRYGLDPAVELVVLRDLRDRRRRRRRPLDRLPTRLRPTPSTRTMSLRTDLLLRSAIRRIRSGVIVSTRPSLHLALVTFARPGVTTIGWDHLNFPGRMTRPGQAAVLRAAVPRLDGYVVLTQADALDYRADLPDARTEIRVIRNSVSWPVAEEPPPLETPVVLAAGRLSSRKGFLRLVRAFAPVAAAHPDWQLHIYGQGEKRKAIRQLVRRLGLQHQVKLRGYTRDLPAAMREASVYAMASRWEGFPMVLIEAMSVGLPVIAFDCPRGPGEVVRHGANGLLIENDRVRAFSRGLLALVEDEQLRRTLGHQALNDAHGYAAGAIAADWTRLIDDLDPRSSSTGTAVLQPADAAG